MTDRFANHTAGFDAPASDAFVITPGSSPLPLVTRAIYVGTDGDIVVTMLAGTSVTFAHVAAGSMLPLRASHVLSGTTASGLIGLV